MSVVPFDCVVSVLSPLISTSDCPILQGAIKMLTKLIEVHAEEVTDRHLAIIMPGLIRVRTKLPSYVTSNLRLQQYFL